MINLEALKNAHTGVLYQIINFINADNSITIIKDKLRMAIRTFNKLSFRPLQFCRGVGPLIEVSYI